MDGNNISLIEDAPKKKELQNKSNLNTKETDLLIVSELNEILNNKNIDANEHNKNEDDVEDEDEDEDNENNFVSQFKSKKMQEKEKTRYYDDVSEIICNKCLKKGHLYSQCPDKKG